MKLWILVGAISIFAGQTAVSMTPEECMGGVKNPGPPNIPDPIVRILDTFPPEVNKALNMALKNEILIPFYQQDLKTFNHIKDLCAKMSVQEQELARLKQVPKP